MTTLDADIALVRRMLEKGWEVQGHDEAVEVRDPTGELRMSDQGSPFWRALVDLARKLEARQKLDDAVYRLAGGQVVSQRDPTAAELLERAAVELDERGALAMRAVGSMGMAPVLRDVAGAIRAALAGRAP